MSYLLDCVIYSRKKSSSSVLWHTPLHNVGTTEKMHCKTIHGFLEPRLTSLFVLFYLSTGLFQLYFHVHKERGLCVIISSPYTMSTFTFVVIFYTQKRASASVNTEQVVKATSCQKLNLFNIFLSWTLFKALVWHSFWWQSE